MTSYETFCECDTRINGNSLGNRCLEFTRLQKSTDPLWPDMTGACDVQHLPSSFTRQMTFHEKRVMNFLFTRAPHSQWQLMSQLTLCKFNIAIFANSSISHVSSRCFLLLRISSKRYSNFPLGKMSSVTRHTRRKKIVCWAKLASRGNEFVYAWHFSMCDVCNVSTGVHIESPFNPPNGLRMLDFLKVKLIKVIAKCHRTTRMFRWPLSTSDPSKSVRSFTGRKVATLEADFFPNWVPFNLRPKWTRGYHTRESRRVLRTLTVYSYLAKKILHLINRLNT